mgnify:CR=1 FL=1
MAFLSRKKEEDALKSEQILLDATLMQNLQDRFCDANNLYLRCLDKNRKWVHNLPQSRKKHSCKTERVNNDVSEAN